MGIYIFIIYIIYIIYNIYIHDTCVFTDVPQLPPLPGVERREEEDEEEDLDDDILKTKKKRPTSGPKVQDPYAADDTGSMMLPVVIAVGAFIPVLFCLCKL